MKRGLFWFLIVLLLVSVLSVSSSEDFYVIPDSTDADIFPDEEAVFNIRVINNMENDVKFQFKFGAEVDWIIDTIPVEAYYTGVDRKSFEDVEVSIRPKNYVPMGRHRVRITIKNTKTGENKVIDFNILIKPMEWKKFLPNVQLKIDMDNDIDPRKATMIKIDLKNLNTFNITNLGLTLNSQLIHEEKIIDLPGISKASEGFLIKLDETQQPIDDVLRVVASVTHNNRSYVWELEEKYEVISYADLGENSSVEKSFLKTQETIVLTNDGNIAKDFEIIRQASFFQRLFTGTTPKAGLLKTADGAFLFWKIALEPQQEVTIIIKKSYRGIFIIAIIALLMIILYYRYRSPVLIKKQVTQVGTSEGGISELKVILHLKSRTRKMIESMHVIDKIPHIAEIGDEFTVGTIKPTKITKTTKKGTLVRWDIPTLDPYEERIITYKVKSKLSIIGGIVLPPALIKFEKKGGKEVRARSNRVTLEI